VSQCAIGHRRVAFEIHTGRVARLSACHGSAAATTVASSIDVTVGISDVDANHGHHGRSERNVAVRRKAHILHFTHEPIGDPAEADRAAR
jgi:hypothetical protein